MKEARFIVIRYKQNDYATYGRMHRMDGTQVGFILERPWVDKDHDNKRDRGESRFVPGTYELYLRVSNKNTNPKTGLPGTGKRDYDVWEFIGVPDCEAAQLHRASFPGDLHGCQGIGKQFVMLEDPHNGGAQRLGMNGSKVTFEAFMEETKGLDRIWIEVVEEWEPEDEG